MCLGAAAKNGHRFLTETQSAGKGQVLYHAFTKPREATTPISTGSIKRPQRRRLVWTSQSPSVTTGEEIWWKKPAQASPSKPAQKMLRNSGAFWISRN